MPYYTILCCTVLHHTIPQARALMGPPAIPSPNPNPNPNTPALPDVLLPPSLLCGRNSGRLWRRSRGTTNIVIPQVILTFGLGQSNVNLLCVYMDMWNCFPPLTLTRVRLVMVNTIKGRRWNDLGILCFEMSHASTHPNPNPNPWGTFTKAKCVWDGK